MELSRSVFKMENWVGDIDLGVTKDIIGLPQRKCLLRVRKTLS